MRKKTKIKTISLRLTEWEYQELQNVLKITKQSQSTFIIIAILEKIQRILYNNINRVSLHTSVLIFLLIYFIVVIHNIFVLIIQEI